MWHTPSTNATTGPPICCNLLQFLPPPYNLTLFQIDMWCYHIFSKQLIQAVSPARGDEPSSAAWWHYIIQRLCGQPQQPFLQPWRSSQEPHPESLQGAALFQCPTTLGREGHLRSECCFFLSVLLGCWRVWRVFGFQTGPVANAVTT